MKRSPACTRADIEKIIVVVLGAVFVFGVVFILWWRMGRIAPKPGLTPPGVVKSGRDKKSPRSSEVPITPPRKSLPTSNLSPAEKTARIEKINRDYDEVRLKSSADYSAAGANFPGGLNAFLGQLALLEREKHADLATVLSPAELEDYEMRETPAGQLVQKWLGDTAATDAQRRAVFRLQRAFEDKFALTFDVTPPALLQRETARHALQEQIHAVLGDALFGAWLQSEGGEYAQFTKFAAAQGLAPEAPLQLWRAKNEFTRRRLEINAQNSERRMSPEQMRATQAALTQQTEARVLAIIGQGAMQTARTEVLGWLPRR
ncbi:MAG TPA: hypothetical protein VM029_05435 [Opitutaceae bacterium]|nr:hypothetical protein [Opitutaceae bacterium]